MLGSIRIDEALKRAKERLKGVTERPLLEAELLLAHALGKDRIYLHTHPEAEVPEQFWELIDRRAAHEPVEYITGKVSFYGKEFLIEPGVLIPRPETERLIEELLPWLRGDERVVEIGVGSGIISTILKLHLPTLHIVATDINPKALALAKKNFQRFGVDIKLRLADLAEGVGECDVIVSNPPYIAKDFPLPPNVAKYEPKEALYGGERGDELLGRIIDYFLKSSAKILACEMGYDQKEAIQKRFGNFDGTLDFYKDLAGLDRGFIARKR